MIDKRLAKVSISMVMAIILSVLMIVPSYVSASELSDDMIIYIESEDEIDSDKLEQGYIYVIPNAEIKAESDADELISQITRGHSQPVSTWNISSKGSYSYSGSSSTGANLYTAYRFTGCSGYKITMNNTSSYSVTTLFKTYTNTFKTFNVTANSSSIFYVNSLNGIDSSTNWYILWQGKCSVNGTISKY